MTLKKTPLFLIILWSSVSIASGLSNNKYTYTSYDIPGNKFISSNSINENGVIAGFFKVNGNDNNHASGFVRTTEGKITQFDVPGARFTLPFQINDNGIITGFFGQDLFYQASGFIRMSDGVITKFDVPGAVITMPFNINTNGVITGFTKKTSGSVNDPSSASGFVRISNDSITIFNVPNAATTYPSSINKSGMITGCYGDRNSYSWTCSNQSSHGFVRTADGVITKFDVPGARATYPMGINDAGVIAGEYTDNQYHTQGFVRTPDGVIKTFSLPGVDLNVRSINKNGVIVGTSSNIRGFMRTLDGQITSFDYPGFKNTWVSDINGAGMIVGDYSNTDDGYSEYGFTLDTKK